MHSPPNDLATVRLYYCLEGNGCNTFSNLLRGGEACAELVAAKTTRIVV